MISLFVDYTALVKRHGAPWILDTNDKVAVKHVLSAVRPISLRTRIKSDLEFTKHKLRKELKGVMAHAVRISKAFELLENAPKSTKYGRNWSSPARGQANSSQNIMPKVKQELRKARDANHYPPLYVRKVKAERT